MSTKMLTNEMLLSAILSGDILQRNQAYRQLYLDQTIKGKVWSMAANYGLNDAETEDLFQEAIIQLDSIILEGRFRNESSVPTFFIAVVRNKMRDKVKAGGKLTSFDEIKNDSSEFNDPEFILTTQEKTVEAQHRDSILKTLLEKIKADCRQLLSRYYYQGMSMAQIATEQGLANSNQAKKAAFRCRQQLRELILSQPGLDNFLKQAL
jgi:RNA polymerase sigma factor (sigma-70 family)